MQQEVYPSPASYFNQEIFFPYFHCNQVPSYCHEINNAQQVQMDMILKRLNIIQKINKWNHADHKKSLKEAETSCIFSLALQMLIYLGNSR